MGGDTIEFKSLIVLMATMVAIVGTYLNLLKEPLCFVLWGGANLVFIWAAFKENQKWSMTVFSVYLAMSVIGLWTW
jgi:hypothetical protein